MNRGSAYKTLARAKAAVASMRPRFMNRGSDYAPLAAAQTPPAASMRPRFMNRGSASTATLVVLF